MVNHTMLKQDIRQKEKIKEMLKRKKKTENEWRKREK